MPNGGRINFQVNMDVKKNGLKDLIEPLKQVQSKMNSISSNGNLDEPFKEAASAAKQLESIINSSWNDKLNQLNLNQFNQSIKTSFKDVESLKNILTQAGPEGQAAFNQVASAVLNTNVQLRESNKLLDSMATSMANTVKWGITSSIFNNITSSIQHAYYYAKDLDSSLNDIRIVTGDSADQMQRFARTANDAAKDLGRSTLDYTKAALSFYQQGLSDDEVKARTEVSLKAQNITGAGSQIYDQLTAVWNGFKVATEDTESVVDKLAAVADNSASNMSQLATAMSKVAATANVMGVDVDQLTAQISTVVAATRLAPESVGTAFKTIYSRLNDIKTGADEAQVSLGNYSGKMAELGFNVLDSAGNLRDTGQVIEQIGGRWQTLTRQQQVYLAQTMGGQRQITQVMALFDNWDKYLNNLNVSMSSQGTLMEKNNTYLESTQAHLQQLGTQAERTYDILFDQDTVNGFVDGLEGVLKIFNDFIDGLGGGAKAFVYFGSVVGGIFNQQIARGIASVQRDFERFKSGLVAFNVKKQFSDFILNETKANNKQAGITGLSNEALEKQATAAQRIFEVQKGLTGQQQKEVLEIQQKIALTQNNVNLLEQQQKKAQDIVKSLEQEQVIQGRSVALLQKDQENLQKSYDLNQKSLISMENMSKSIEKIDSGTLSWQQHQQIQKNLLEQIDNESENLRDTWIAAGGSSEGFEKHVKNIKQYVSGGNVSVRTFQASWRSIESVTRTYANNQKADLEKIDLYLKNIGIDTSKLTTEEKLKLQVLIEQNEQYAKQAQAQLQLQKKTRTTMSIIQAVTAIAGGLETAFRQGATSADRMNGAWTALTGTASAIVSKFSPLAGMAVQAGASLVKVVLQTSGIWDKIENHFKSTNEKAEELSNNLKENLDKAMQPLNKKKSLESLKEEFDELSKKAGEYGQNLSLMTEEQQSRYKEIVDQIKEINPDIVQGFTDQGDAIINNNNALDKTLEKLQKQYELQQSLTYSKENISSAIDVAKSASQDIQNPKFASFDKSELLDNLNYGMGLSWNSENQSWIASGYQNYYDELIDSFQNEYNLPQKSVDNLKKYRQELLQNLNNAEDDIELISEAYNDFLFKIGEYTNLQDSKRGLEVFNPDDNVQGPKDWFDDNVNSKWNSAIRFYFLDQFLKNISASDIKSKIQEIQDQVAQNETLYEDAKTSVKNLMAGALKFTSGYNEEYKRLQEIFGEDFENGPSDIIDSIITNELDKFDFEKYDIQDWETIIPETINTILRETFNSIDKDKLINVNKQLEDLFNQTIDETNPLSINTYNDKIKQLINDFINSTDLQTLLADTEKKDQTISFLELLFGGSLEFDDNNQVTEFKDKISQQAQQVFQQIQNLDITQFTTENVQNGNDLINSYLQGKSRSQIQAFFDYFNDQFTNNYAQLQSKIANLGLGSVIEDFYKQLADDDAAKKGIQHFDKITSAINKLQSGKDLKYSEKEWLATNILPEESLEKLQSNADWLGAIVQYVINLPDEVQKQAGFEAIFKDFETFEKYKDQLSQGDRKTAFTIALQNEKEALQMNTQALQNYAQLYESVADASTQQGQKEIIETIKKQNALKSLTEQAKALAESTGEMDETSLLNFTTGLQEELGKDLDPKWVKQHIDGIASALAIGIDSSKLEQYAENYVPPIASKFSEEFDKVTSIINTIQNSENLSHADKEWLKQALGITDQELQQLDTNEKLLQEIAEKILTIADPDKRANAFGLIYKDLDSYYDDVAKGVFNKGKGLVPSNVPQANIGGGLLNQGNQEAHQAALENSMAAYNVDPTFLQAYGESIHKAYLSTQQLFNLWKQQADGDTLKSLSENLAKNKDQLEANDRQVIEFQQQLKNLVGIDVSTDYIVANIEAISKAFKDGLISGQELEQFIGNFKPETEQGPNAYQKQRDLTKNAVGAKSALQSGSALSDDQATALAQLESSNTQLATLGQSQGRNSEAYLNLLQQILNTENAITEEKKAQALQDSEALQKKLEEQKLELQQKYDKEYDYRTTAERQELLKQIADINQQITAQQAKQIQLSQADVEQYKDKYHTLQQLQEGFIKGEITQDQYGALRPDILQDQIKALGRTKEEFNDFVDVLQQSSKYLKTNRKAAQELAITEYKIQDAVEDLVKNFDDYAEKIKNAQNLTQDAKLADQDYISSIASLRTAMTDLLGVDLSNQFFDNAYNLQLMKDAIDGNIQSLIDLRIQAAEDIVQHIDLDLEQGSTERIWSIVQDFILNTDFDSLEVGAEIDISNVVSGLYELMGVSEEATAEINKILSSLGVQTRVSTAHSETTVMMPDIQYTHYKEDDGNGGFTFYNIPVAGSKAVTVPADTPIIESTEKGTYKGNRGFSNYNNSHPTTPKSGGGGGGGGKKPKGGGGGKADKPKEPKKMDLVEEKFDRYHDINIDLKHINDQLQKLQDNEKKLTGKDLVKNLEAQLKVLEKQKEAYQDKLELEKQERDEIKKDLEKQGAKFDPNGDISNYATLTSTALSDLNKEIAKYNAMTAEQQQKYEDTVQAARKRYDTLLENIDRYDDIVSSEIPELQKQIRDTTDQIVEKQIQKFKIKVDLQLDLSKAERDFNEFRKKVINKIKDDDILGNTKTLLKDFSSYYKKGGKGVITGLTNQVNDTLEQLYSIDKTGTSSVYGDNRAAALKDLQEYTNKLMENLEDVEDLVDDIKESIFDAIDKAQDAFDEQVNEYQFISKIIDHDVKMVKLLYGDDAYESMNKYHSQQQENNNKQLDFLKRQKDYWAGQMAAEQARMNNLDPGTAAFKEAQKRFEEYKKHWMSSVEDLNSKLEDSLENVIDKYTNAIDLTFDKLNKKLTDGKGLEYVNEEWQLINKKSDMYLDKINSMYEIDKLENAYQDLLKDNEGNLAAQRSIKDMMKEQIAYLRDKDKLTQYDVDRANALLQIEVKRLALEQQRQSKTKLRLRRDSQGNYTYQYTADQESLDNAEQELRDAENSLYNMTRQAYKNNLKDFYDTYSDWQDRIKEVAKNTTLTVEEQQQQMAMLNQYYGDMINGYVEENANLQKFLMQDAFDELSTMYGTDVKNYESMIQDEKQALMEDLVPQWDSSVQDMIAIFAGENGGKKGFLPTVQDAFEGIDAATEQYEASLDTLQQVAGVNFQDIANGMDATSVEAQKLLDDNITLINAYGAEVNAVQGVINKVEQMQSAYGLAEAAAIAAAQAASKYIQKEGDLNKVAAAAQAAKSAVEAAAAARAAANNSNPSSPSSGGGGGNTGSGSGSSGGGSGSGNGGGNTPSNSNKGKITSIYGPNGPSTVQWRRDSSGKIRYGSGYATGGYTGAWGDEGKIAILHEKELVLNKEDTANMLQAVSIVRTMNDLLSNINSSTDFINTIGFGSGNNNQTLEQNVHIEASFPNVTDHFEIEQALNNLVNRASQFAFKN